MTDFIDPVLVGEIATVVTAITQWIKTEPRLKRVDGEHLALTVGLIVACLWFLVRGRLGDELSLSAVEWQNVFRAVMNGVLGGIGASGVYNLQKFLPIPNLLPSRSEKERAWENARHRRSTETAVQPVG